MRETIKKVPVPVCGVMLGTAALGNLLQSYSEALRYICGVFCGVSVALDTVEAVPVSRYGQKKIWVIPLWLV